MSLDQLDTKYICILQGCSSSASTGELNVSASCKAVRAPIPSWGHNPTSIHRGNGRHGIRRRTHSWLQNLANTIGPRSAVQTGRMTVALQMQS